jgi:anti-sigma B factor antagonist
VPLTHSTQELNGTVVLRLNGSLDAMTAPELMPTIDRLIQEKRPRVTVELDGLNLIDSSGVAAIVALYKRMRASGGRVTVTGARDQPLAIFKLLRMDRVFEI